MVNQRRAELLEQVFTEYSDAAVLADPARLAAWEERGLTMSQLRVLIILNGDPGMTAGNLAERLSVRPSTVTEMVDRLVKQELVERRADPDDRRVVRNFLSATGERGDQRVHGRRDRVHQIVLGAAVRLGAVAGADGPGSDQRQRTGAGAPAAA